MFCWVRLDYVSYIKLNCVFIQSYHSKLLKTIEKRGILFLLNFYLSVFYPFFCSFFHLHFFLLNLFLSHFLLNWSILSLFFFSLSFICLFVFLFLLVTTYVFFFQSFISFLRTKKGQLQNLKKLCLNVHFPRKKMTSKTFVALVEFSTVEEFRNSMQLAFEEPELVI